MNATDITLRGLAMLGKPRAKQSVHRCTSRYIHDRDPRHVVLVTPDGAEFGVHYEVSDRTWKLLQDGQTPDELELEPYEPHEEDE
jgi:hypothetical protein